MKEYVEPGHAGNEDEDKEYLDVNSERSPIGYEGKHSENEQDTESFLNQKSAVSLDNESPNSRLSDGQRAEYGLKAVERVEKSAQKSAPRKRKTSIDQEDGPSSQEKLPKRRKAQPKTDAEISLLKNEEEERYRRIWLLLFVLKFSIIRRLIILIAYLLFE